MVAVVVVVVVAVVAVMMVVIVIAMAMVMVTVMVDVMPEGTRAIRLTIKDREFPKCAERRIQFKGLGYTQASLFLLRIV